MAITLRDVARDAGVSVRTVSYVVSGFDRISEETRARVQQSLDKLAYRPNMIARQLRSGRTGMIALAVPDLGVPYFSELVQVVVSSARDLGFTVVIEQTDGSPELERSLLQRDGRGALFDGLILSPLALSAAQVAELAGDLRVVMLGERESEHRLDHVAIDNLAASRTATEHLISLGRKRIAVIGLQTDQALLTAHLRERGFREAMADAGLPVQEKYLQRVDDFHREPGAQAMATLLADDEPPDAVFCFNDLLALGALRAALVAGVRVPKELAIIGFDDVEDGRYSTPTLSTIRPNKHQIGTWAVQNLMARINGDASKPREHLATFDLVQRESTGLRKRRTGARRAGASSVPNDGWSARCS